MPHYNTLNVKLSNWQFNKLKSGIKNGTDVTLELSSNVVGDSNDENNFLHKLLLTNTQIPNNSSSNVKLSKTQLHKIKKSGGFLSRLLGPTAEASATDVAIDTKMFGSGVTTLIILNEEMNDIMKIVNLFC